MKKLITFLFFLSIAVVGSFYFYSSNNNFKNTVNDFTSRYLNRQDNEPVEEINSSKNINQEESKSSNVKIPKKLNPDNFFLLDEYARKCPKKYENNLSSLVEYLQKPANTEIEKVRVLFVWIATHINYDDNAFNSGQYPEYTAEYVLTNKRAVCEGYSNLLKSMCDLAGLESEKITGYAKGYGYNIGDKFTDTDHAWNVIKVNGKWKLFDVTWAAGSGRNINGKLVTKLKFDPFWFDVNPMEFIFTHLPVDLKWQLLSNPITLQKFEDLPYLDNTFFKLRFNSSEVYQNAVSGRINKFAETFPIEYPITAVQLPYTYWVSKLDAIDFSIECEYAEEVALIEDNEWYYFEKDKNKFKLSHKPRGKELSISVKINSFDKNFYSVIKYKTIDKENKTDANNL